MNLLSLPVQFVIMIINHRNQIIPADFYGVDLAWVVRVLQSGVLGSRGGRVRPPSQHPDPQ